MEELIGKESEDSEHHMEMDFSMTSHSRLSTAEFVLEPRVDPFAHAALVVSSGGRRVKGGRVLPRPFRSMIGR